MEDERDELHEMDLREMGRLIAQYGLMDLPWQLSGESHCPNRSTFACLS